MTDRNQVAREVLTEIAEHLRSYGESNAPLQAVVQQYRDTHYPAPAAPVTVTVRTPDGCDTVMTKTDGTTWTWPGGAVAVGPFSVALLDRIAADAQRIAELECECQRLQGYIDVAHGERDDAWSERDEARRALEELQAATSQGEGLGKITEAEQVAAEEPGDSRVTVEAAPAPIPSGDVTFKVSEFRKYWRANYNDGCVLTDSEWHLERLLRAIRRSIAVSPPVADAATVARVALRVKQYNGPTAVSAEGFARIILEELGYTIQEGAE